MLCISMRAGDYFIVGDSTVVQYDRLSGDRVHLTVNAPPRGSDPARRRTGAQRRKAA